MKYDDTNIAERYDSARRMSEASRRVWFDAIKRRIPRDGVRRIVDVGCGTGRFSALLAEEFDAEVIGVDPSRTMLAKARAGNAHPRVRYLEGEAGKLPVEDGSCCLVFLSMVYHHIPDAPRAAAEFRRALRPGGHVCIRNSTIEQAARFPYQRYFPGVAEIHRRTLPPQDGVIGAMRSAGLRLVAHDLVQHRFADSLAELFERVSQRALSDLAALPDAEFEAGLQAMRAALEAGTAAPGPIIEPVDLFVFTN